MSLYLTRMGITLLGVAALTAGSYVVSQAHTKPSFKNAASPYTRALLHIEMEGETWASPDQRCNCSHDEDSNQKTEATDDHEDCSKPSPAERMGMAIRLVSL